MCLSGWGKTSHRRPCKVSHADRRPSAEVVGSVGFNEKEGEEEREDDGCESAALARSRMLLEDFDELARPPAPTYVPAARPAQTVDDESESESEDGVREYDAGDDATGAADADVDVGRRINLVFQAPNGERFTRGAGEREKNDLVPPRRAHRLPRTQAKHARGGRADAHLAVFARVGAERRSGERGDEHPTERHRADA